MNNQPMSADQEWRLTKESKLMYEIHRLLLEHKPANAVAKIRSFAQSESEAARLEGMKIAWEGCGSSNCSCRDNSEKYPPVKPGEGVL